MKIRSLLIVLVWVLACTAQTITKVGTDGCGGSCDESTITDAEANLGTGTQIIEIYSGTYAEDIVINDPDPDSLIIRSFDSSLDNVTVTNNATTANTITINTVYPVVIEWLNIGQVSPGMNDVTAVRFENNSGNSLYIRNCEIYGDAVQSSYRQRGIYHAGSGGTNSALLVMNCIVRDFKRNFSTSINAAGAALPVEIYNCVFYNNDKGVLLDNDPYEVQFAVNTIAIGNTDYDFSTDGVVNFRNNLSGDATAVGDDSVRSATLADVLTDAANGDFTLKDSNSPAFEAGYDVGTTPNGVEIDLAGYDRDSGGTTWSIGAFDGNELRTPAGGDTQAAPRVIIINGDD